MTTNDSCDIAAVSCISKYHAMSGATDDIAYSLLIDIVSCRAGLLSDIVD